MGRFKKLVQRDVVGPWTLHRQLGRGGNGAVWFCHHSDRSTGSAVKFLNNSGGEAIRRFRDEVVLQQKLSGRPNIVPLLDASSPEKSPDEERPWFSMPEVRELQKELANADLEQVLAALVPLAERLAELHAEGISHRDLKPDNLFWYNDAPALGDFGLASFEGKDVITKPGKKLGPLHFIAPEMMFSPESADGRKADVFSFAKTLWTLGAGTEFPPPGEQRTDTPQVLLSGYYDHPRVSVLDRLIERATWYDPNQRLTMVEFVKELKEWLEKPVTSNPKDIADIAERLRAAKAPILSDQQQRNKLTMLALDTERKLRSALVPMAQEFYKASGQQPNHYDSSVGMTMLVFDDDMMLGQVGRLSFGALGDQRIIWSKGFCFGEDTPGVHSLTCRSGFGLKLDETGILHLSAAHVLTYVYNGQYGGHPEIFGQVIREARVGTAELENVCAEMMASLTDSFPDHLVKYTEWINNMRKNTS